MRKTLLGILLVAFAELPGSGAAIALPGTADSLPPSEADSAIALPEIDLSLRLRPSPRLAPQPPGLVTGELPVFLRADRIEGPLNGTITAYGAAEMRQRGLSIMADELRYAVPDERCTAEGHVEIHRGADVVTGPRAEFNMKDQSGRIEEPLLQFAAAPGGRAGPARASASLAVFPDTAHEHLEQAAYTTCAAGQDDWFLTGSTVDLDRTTQIGEAHNARVIFQGVPLLYSPYMTFPLNDQRKSGFLAPTFGTNATNGVDISVPYYFNLAPNFDDTLTPRVMSKRGLQLSDEFRYLEPSYHGVLTGELLDRDTLAGMRRYLFGVQHDQTLPGGVTFHANAQEVSDSGYFRDLSMLVNATSITYLPRDFSLGWNASGWALGARALSYQTIQDPVLVVPDQYRMAPQLTANYSTEYDGLSITMPNEIADFRHATLVQGQRFVTYPSVSLPMVRDWGYLTPKIGYHYTEYNLEALPAQGTPAERQTRGLPIASLDGGLFFDRPLQLFDRSLVQTLEPRLYYLDIPYRDQSQLPLFNTGVAQFSYNQLFSENEYSGPDRINDARQLTVAVQSRLLEPETGVEDVRGLIGQRFYFRHQGVIIPGEIPRPGNVSDFLAGLSGRITQAMSADVAWDYNPSVQRTEALALTWHYRPEPAHALNLGYRINRDTPGQPDIRQIDVSGEWPVGGHWTAVWRVNYDTAQSILVEGLAGAEYTAGCWTVRIVAHRLAVSAVQTSSALFVQLELNGLFHLGTNPLDALRLNIPGYTKTNEMPQ